MAKSQRSAAANDASNAATADLFAENAPPIAGAALPEAEPADAAATDDDAPRISYDEAQRLMAIGREHGPQALTPEQHNAIWDCLLARPESQAWLTNQLTALKGELQERGLRPW